MVIGKIGPGELLNKTDLCRAFGATRAQFETWVRQGMPIESRGGKSEEVMVYAGTCLAWIMVREGWLKCPCCSALFCRDDVKA